VIWSGAWFVNFTSNGRRDSGRRHRETALPLEWQPSRLHAHLRKWLPGGEFSHPIYRNSPSTPYRILPSFSNPIPSLCERQAGNRMDGDMRHLVFRDLSSLISHLSSLPTSTRVYPNLPSKYCNERLIKCKISGLLQIPQAGQKAMRATLFSTDLRRLFFSSP